jgi:MFS family permease
MTLAREWVGIFGDPFEEGRHGEKSTALDILIGFFLIVLGLAITFAGTALFFLVLPMVGFLFGFFVGAAVVQSAFGDGFLNTVGRWAVGIILGLVFGFISYYWWYAGVLLSAGSIGAVIATGLAQAIGLDSGFWHLLFGLVGFIALASVTYVFNLPVYLVIASTAIAGANLAVLGVMLVFNRVDTDEMVHGTAATIVRESWWWTLIALVVAVIGAGYQLSVRNRLRLPQEKWVVVTSR